jgi:hypothetical protein
VAQVLLEMVEMLLVETLHILVLVVVEHRIVTKLVVLKLMLVVVVEQYSRVQHLLQQDTESVVVEAVETVACLTLVREHPQPAMAQAVEVVVRVLVVFTVQEEQVHRELLSCDT